MSMALKLIIGIFLIVNIAAYVTYGRDKHLAKAGKWRIPEKVLLSLSFFGGAAGALTAMQLFRHKTRHWYFYAVGIAGLLWQTALLIVLCIKTGGIPS